MKVIYSLSTSLCATKSRFSWESGAAEVEYLFMGNISGDRREITKGNHDFIDVGINGLNAKPQLDTRCGRYRQRDAVPK